MLVTRPYSTITLVLLLGCLILLISGCDSTDIDPFDNDERYFTVYGYLDELETNHSVRVIPITRFQEIIDTPLSDQAQIDATVISTDLESGITTRWRHSLERLENGEYGHIFRANFLVRPGRTYRLEVIRADSTKTIAETTIPRIGVPRPIPSTIPFPYESNMDDGLKRTIELPGISSPWDIIVTYDLSGSYTRLSYGRVGSKNENGNWQFELDTTKDAERIRAANGIPSSSPLPPLHVILLQVRILDQNWDPPYGVFDPEVLAQPNVLSNVVNGQGFWGGVGLYQYVWTVNSN